MIGLALCIVAALATYVAARRSLAAGLQALFVVGYFYGVARGRFADGFTHFAFDASLLSLYAAQFSQTPSEALLHRSSMASLWAKTLMIWPLVCMTYSPLMTDAQPLIIQLVGLRGAIIMLPCLILGARIVTTDLDRLAPVVAVLNCVALGFAGIEYVFGVGAVVPQNRATELIYASADVMAQHETFHRIPSMFINAHMYGGVMTLSIPFVLHGLDGKGVQRLLCIAGLAAAGIGVFVCGARTPVVAIGLASIYALLSMRARFGTLIAFAAVGASIYYLVTHNERLQRFETLGDTDYVQARIGTSVNSDIMDLMAAYPAGAGLASAFGTSVPYFMQTLANPAIGIESEYGHLLVEQGIVGLLLWLGFLGWLFTRVQAPAAASPLATKVATALIFIQWGLGGLGVGMLAAMPGTPLLLFLCGMRGALPAREARRLALRHVGNLQPEAPLRSAFTGRTANR